MLTLYQAEWCPFSSAVREVLTELGVDFVARQVEPWPDERRELQTLRRLSTRSLSCRPRTAFSTVAPGRSSRTCASSSRGSSPEHRGRFADHRDARESDAPGQLVEYFPSDGGARTCNRRTIEAEVVDVPDATLRALRLAEPRDRPRRVPAPGRPDRLHAHRGRRVVRRARLRQPSRGRCVGRRAPAGSRGRPAVPVHRALHRTSSTPKLLPNGYRTEEA